MGIFELYKSFVEKGKSSYIVERGKSSYINIIQIKKKKKKNPFYSLHHLKYKCVKVQVSKNKNEPHIHKYLDRIKFKFCIKKNNSNY